MSSPITYTSVRKRRQGEEEKSIRPKAFLKDLNLSTYIDDGLVTFTAAEEAQ